ncbi:MAG: hypothetical protein OEV87_11615 [Phycisphaerae bacterium]|nr:hypothetical protein [Phycisphaerae bacterium]
MNILQQLQYAGLVKPQGVDNTVFANNAAVDTRGLLELAFLVHAGDLAAAVGSTAAANAIKVEECDTEGGSYSDVANATLADAIAADEDGGLFLIVVDLKKSHKRFMRLNAPTAGDGSGTSSYISAVAIGIPDKMPVNATEAGLTELILPSNS